MRFGAFRRGYLLDLDYAKDEDEEYHPNPGHRTGTKPFMSSGVLSGKGDYIHEEHDDLESFYNVFIYGCVNYIAPRTQRPGALPAFMNTWMYDSPTSVGTMKSGQLLR